MLQQKTIVVPKGIPLSLRISEVSGQILDWIKSLERPFNVETDRLRLALYVFNKNEHVYRYEILQADIMKKDSEKGDK